MKINNNLKEWEVLADLKGIKKMNNDKKKMLDQENDTFSERGLHMLTFCLNIKIQISSKKLKKHSSVVIYTMVSG